MKIKCDYCGKEFSRRPSEIKAENYCCKECRHSAKIVIVKCDTCGKEFEKWKGCVFEHNFCSCECAKTFTGSRMTSYNLEHNPDAMTPERRQKLRNARLGKGAGKTYTKTFGRHTHRIVAEQMLGGPLKLGEVVHHINGDKRDNRPDNLLIFPSQAEHAYWHEVTDGNPQKRRGKSYEIQSIRVSEESSSMDY